ncbi:MAG: ABC transporter permease [Firmicutes bacterium]|nr:ABC transporter permease [Bacillota bacterium]
MSFKKLSIGALMVFSLLLIINDLAIENISKVINTDKSFYEISKRDDDIYIKIEDLDELETTLNTQILLISKEKRKCNILGKEYDFTLKGIKGNYISFFPIKMKRGTFYFDKNLDTKYPIVMDEKIVQKIFKSEDILGFNFSNDKKTYEITGILKRNFLSILSAKENIAYIPLVSMKDDDFKVPIEAIYIMSEDYENKKLNITTIKKVLSQYGIKNRDINITKIHEYVNKLKIMQTIVILILTFLIAKDLYKILKIRWKKFHTVIRKNMSNNDFKIKENINLIIREIIVIIVSILVLGYLIYKIPIKYLPIKEIMKEDVITLTYYLNTIKGYFKESFINRNQYLTSLNYITKVFYSVGAITFIISFIPLMFYRKYKGVENNFFMESISIIIIIMIFYLLSFKISYIFLINKDLLILLTTLTFIENIKTYLIE